MSTRQRAPSRAGPQPDEEQVQLNDFEALFQRFRIPITNFIYRLVGNREQAYDLAQDVFVKAYKALLDGTIVQPGALSAWLYRIATNTTMDTLRRKRLITWLPLSLYQSDRGIGAGVARTDGFAATHQGSDEGTPAGPRPTQNIYEGGRFEDQIAEREILSLVFAQIPPKYATCLWLYEHDGFSCAEIAQMLNITPSAVKMRLMRARERFIALYRKQETRMKAGVA